MMSSPYSSNVYDNRYPCNNVTPPHQNIVIPETIYYPNLPIPDPLPKPIPIEPTPIPIEPTPIPESKPTEDKNDETARANEVKLFYESKTRELILTQSKSSLDLFKIIHHTLEDFQTQIKALTEAIVELSSIIAKQQETINLVNDSVGSLAKQIYEPKEIVEPVKEIKKDPKPSPFLKKSTSFSSVGQKNFPRPK